MFDWVLNMPLNRYILKEDNNAPGHVLNILQVNNKDDRSLVLLWCLYRGL